MSQIDANQLLSQMRAMAAQARGADAAVPSAEGTGVSFADQLVHALQTVSEAQQSAGALAASFEQGDPQISLSQVMIAQQKASLSFQTVLQVRNKLVSAYEDVMKMPV